MSRSLYIVDSVVMAEGKTAPMEVEEAYSICTYTHTILTSVSLTHLQELVCNLDYWIACNSC